MPERSRRAMHRPPRPRGRILVGPLLLGLVLFGTGEALGQQNLGHKVLGGVGIDAGTQVEPGLYFAGRVLHFGADELRDRDGDPVPLEGLDIDAVGVRTAGGSSADHGDAADRGARGRADRRGAGRPVRCPPLLRQGGISTPPPTTSRTRSGTCRISRGRRARA